MSDQDEGKRLMGNGANNMNSLATAIFSYDFFSTPGRRQERRRYMDFRRRHGAERDYILVNTSSGYPMVNLKDVCMLMGIWLCECSITASGRKGAIRISEVFDAYKRNVDNLPDFPQLQ